MPFPDKVKRRVRERAWFACCLCKRISVALEVHHILPHAARGPDSEDNAAPLCPSCHESFGGNPDHRARIRTMRDHWYDACENLFRPADNPVDVFRSLHETFSVEELERLTVHNPTYLLGKDGALALEETRFSFRQPEYVHPRIVKELLGWISDSSPAVIAVDLDAGNRSNQFHGDFTVEEDAEGVRVHWEDEWEDEESSFWYRHVATTPSGVEILECHDWMGGSGVFGSIALFSLERDRALETDGADPSARERTVLRAVGNCGLGDRYRGDITYAGGLLEVGPDRGWFKRGEEAAWRLPVL